jgi:hypothetical protein
MRYRCLLVLALVTVPGFAAAQPELTKTLSADVAAVTTIAIDASVANLRLTTVPGAEVRASVVLDSRDEERLPQCARAELTSRREGGTLRLALSQSGRRRCGEQWSVEVPAGVAVDVTVAVGSIQAVLKGAYGDVDLRASVGRASLELNGHRLQTTRKHGATESVSVDGAGARLALHSKVGNVDASVTTKD